MLGTAPHKFGWVAVLESTAQDHYSRPRVVGARLRRLPADSACSLRRMRSAKARAAALPLEEGHEPVLKTTSRRHRAAGYCLCTCGVILLCFGALSVPSDALSFIGLTAPPPPHRPPRHRIHRHHHHRLRHHHHHRLRHRHRHLHRRRRLFIRRRTSRRRHCLIHRLGLPRRRSHKRRGRAPYSSSPSHHRLHIAAKLAARRQLARCGVGGVTAPRRPRELSSAPSLPTMRSTSFCKAFPTAQGRLTRGTLAPFAGFHGLGYRAAICRMPDKASAPYTRTMLVK